MQDYRDPYNPLNLGYQHPVVDTFAPPPGIGAQPIIPSPMDFDDVGLGEGGGRFHRFLHKLGSAGGTCSCLGSHKNVTIM